MSSPVELASPPLAILEALLEVPTTDLREAVSAACDLVSRALGADKVDGFLLDPSRQSLVAVGTSHQPLSLEQRRAGLDVLPLANGGRAVQVFLTGTTFVDGHVDADPEELLGLRETLRIRSTIAVPVDIGGARRGVLHVSSLTPERFTPSDARFTEIVARWVGVVVHRAELVEELTRTASEEGRRAAAEELVTVLAHDLRNHLSPIALRLSLVRRRMSRDDQTADARDLDLALQGLNRLGALVADLLDVSRIEQGAFAVDPQPVELGAVVESCVALMSSREHPIDVHVPEPVGALADEARTRQVLENLVSNAITHSPDAARVTVTVTREMDARGPWARLEVVDQGPGIPPELLPRIFERFVRGKGGRHAGGLGLGLYLAKRIAEAHGGELAVDSRPGMGTRFTLRLPGVEPERS